MVRLEQIRPQPILFGRCCRCCCCRCCCCCLGAPGCQCIHVRWCCCYCCCCCCCCARLPLCARSLLIAVKQHPFDRCKGAAHANAPPLAAVCCCFLLLLLPPRRLAAVGCVF